MKHTNQTSRTGWDNGLSQDYNRALGKWFADRLGARYQLKVMYDKEETFDKPRSTSQGSSSTGRMEDSESLCNQERR
jgi:hypothetical protein